VTGKVVAAGQERRLVDRCGHDARDAPVHREPCRSFYGEPTKLAGRGRISARRPFADFFSDVDPDPPGAHHQNVAALANPWVGERL